MVDFDEIQCEEDDDVAIDQNNDFNSFFISILFSGIVSH